VAPLGAAVLAEISLGTSNVEVNAIAAVIPAKRTDRRNDPFIENSVYHRDGGVSSGGGGRRPQHSPQCIRSTDRDPRPRTAARAQSHECTG
jgi:hypothetical protein